MEKIFNTQREIELLQGAFDEADNLRNLAWDRVSDAMLAACEVKVGDLVEYTDYWKKEFTLRINKMFVRRTKLFSGGYSWEIRSSMYPLKKDGNIALKGEKDSSDVEKDLKSGKLRLIPEVWSGAPLK